MLQILLLYVVSQIQWDVCFGPMAKSTIIYFLIFGQQTRQKFYNQGWSWGHVQFDPFKFIKMSFLHAYGPRAHIVNLAL